MTRHQKYPTIYTRARGLWTERELNATSGRIMYQQGMAYARKGEKREAVENARELEKLGVHLPYALSYAGQIYARAGLKRDATRVKNELLRRAEIAKAFAQQVRKAIEASK